VQIKMSSNLKFDLISISQIDIRPGPCCMSFGFDLEPLIQSIERVGLLNAPVVLRRKDGDFMVITGYKRILAHRELNFDRVSCRIMTADDLSPLEGLLINLYDNLATRTLNPVEKGMVLARLEPWVSRDEIRRRYMPLLGLPSHEETRRLYLTIDRDLDNATKRALVEERLGIKGLKLFMEFEPSARTAVSDLLEKIKLNVNQQLQLFEYLDDLSHIENRSINDILGGGALTEVVSSKHLNTPQKAKAVLGHLRQRRLPAVQEADRVFKRQIAAFPIPEGVQIVAPPYFEGSHFKMTIRFKDGRELTKQIKQLDTIEGLSSLDLPWKKTGL
jgi:ParB-like chromosome segregation protein Spo0J